MSVDDENTEGYYENRRVREEVEIHEGRKQIIEGGLKERAGEHEEDRRNKLLLCRQ